MDIVPFAPGHLEGVLGLCRAEGWTSLPEDPERARRALTAPGAITVVAVDGGEVVGFAQALTDGEIQAYLCNIAVAEGARRRGIGERLLEEALSRSGAMRIDLLATGDSEAFYRAREHRQFPGYRLY